ncbi:MAG: ATP-binding cassette domain-containing protein [Epsilonproteobacteria bacterium]|nr:ATP-binding cassette domain-containing protein [Campylobacterota bacterium]
MGTLENRDIVLEIKDLTFGYRKDKLIYKDFNLKVRRGEVVSIVGESGSGKSTLFELIANNLKPIKGEIKRGKIGWIFQDPYSSFHPSYTILDQIKDVAINMDYESKMDSLNLNMDILNSLPHNLSGGQLQRCSILRAILMEPDILLCDEPTSALDNITQLETMKLLISLLDKLAILLITHDLDLAKWASDKIVHIGSKNENI